MNRPAISLNLAQPLAAGPAAIPVPIAPLLRFSFAPLLRFSFAPLLLAALALLPFPPFLLFLGFHPFDIVPVRHLAFPVGGH